MHNDETVAGHPPTLRLADDPTVDLIACPSLGSPSALDREDPAPGVGAGPLGSSMFLGVGDCRFDFLDAESAGAEGEG